MLSIEVSVESDQVFVHGSPEELRNLARQIERLASWADEGKTDHIHLFSEAWGGNDLAGDSSLRDKQCSAVHHLKLYAWPDSPAKE